MVSKKLPTIQIVFSQSQLLKSFVPALCEIFESIGCRATLITTPQQVSSNCDLLFFIGPAIVIEPFIPVVHRLYPMPPIACWYLEPLPPPNMSPAAIKIAQRLASCYWPQIIIWPLPFLRKFIDGKCKSKPRRNAIIIFFQKMLSYRLKMALKANGYDCSNSDHYDMFKMMNRFQNICEVARNLPIDNIFTSTVSRCEILGNAGLKTFMVPVGYHPILGEPLGLERDIDVVFLGHLRKNCGKRGQVIKYVFAELERQGYNVKIITADCFGAERTRLMNRTKILLDVVRLPWELPGVRLLIAAGCGAMIVTTGFSGDSSPYVQGQHFIEAPASKLVDTLLYYLKNESHRKRISDQAYHFITHELTLRKSISQIMEFYNAHPVISPRSL
jgi:hypothetical protein